MHKKGMRYHSRYNWIYKWRWTPGDKAVVPAPELPFTYRISIALVPAPELSLLWRHISPFKNMTSQERQLWSGNESYRNSVRERQLWSGNDSFVTWRSPSYAWSILMWIPWYGPGRCIPQYNLYCWMCPPGMYRGVHIHLYQRTIFICGIAITCRITNKQ